MLAVGGHCDVPGLDEILQRAVNDSALALQLFRHRTLGHLRSRRHWTAVAGSAHRVWSARVAAPALALGSAALQPVVGTGRIVNASRAVHDPLSRRSTSARPMISQHFRLTGSVKATECGGADTTTTGVHRVGIERRAAIDTDTGSGQVCRCRGQKVDDRSGTSAS